MSESLLAQSLLSSLSGGSLKTAQGSLSLNVRPTYSPSQSITLPGNIIFIVFTYGASNPAANNTYSFAAIANQSNLLLGYSWAPGSGAGYSCSLYASISGANVTFSATGDAGMGGFQTTMYYAAIIENS